MDRKSAAFGSISELQKQGSQQDFIDKSDAAFDQDSQVKELVGPHIDQTGRSDESSERDSHQDTRRQRSKQRAASSGVCERENNAPCAGRLGDQAGQNRSESVD